MQIIKELEQGSADWHAVRCGIVTASEIGALLVNGKGVHGFGAGAITYLHQLIGERITGQSADQFNGNRHTERGHELEPVARQLYTERTDAEIETVGIVLNHGAGYSPDGLIGNDGLLEIKTKIPAKQCEVILGGEIPGEHIHQCQAGLWLAEREWIDFVSYWPGMPLFVQRAYRDEPLIKQMAERLERFYYELEVRLHKILGTNP